MSSYTLEFFVHFMSQRTTITNAMKRLSDQFKSWQPCLRALLVTWPRVIAAVRVFRGHPAVGVFVFPFGCWQIFLTNIFNRSSYGKQFALRIAAVASVVVFAQVASSDETPGHLKHGIVFESYEVDNWDLFIIRSDGTGRRNLTNTRNVHEMYPQASPDGSKICYLEDVQRNGKTIRSVVYMNVDGSGRTPIAEKVRQPCWSPDGTRIAFVTQLYQRFLVDDHMSRGLFVHDLKSGMTREHSNAKIEHLYGLSWTGDGVWIVSTVHGGMGYGHAILAIEVNGLRVHDLKISGCRPCCSPDGNQITWSRDDHTICVGDLKLTEESGGVSNVRVVEHREDAHLYHPDFSPDGQFIAFSVGPGGRVLANGPGTHTQVAEMVGVRGKWNLFAKPTHGKGEPVQLTLDDSLSNKEPEWIRFK